MRTGIFISSFRVFLPPVLDHCQYAKEEGLDLLHVLTSYRLRVDTPRSHLASYLGLEKEPGYEGRSHLTFLCVVLRNVVTVTVNICMSLCVCVHTYV